MKMASLLKTPYFEFMIGSVAQHFTNLVVMVEMIEPAIKVGTVNSEVIMESELGNGSQIRNLVGSDLTISSAF